MIDFVKANSDAQLKETLIFAERKAENEGKEFRTVAIYPTPGGVVGWFETKSMNILNVPVFETGATELTKQNSFKKGKRT